MGAGVLSAIGLDCGQTESSLLASRSGIGQMRFLQTAHSDFPVGEVPLSDADLKRRVGWLEGIPVTRSAMLGMLALKQALNSAGLDTTELSRAAFVSGATVGGMECSEQYYLDFLENDSKNSYISLHDVGANTSMIADHFGRFGYVASVSTACSSAANAIVHAARLIENGEVDIAVAGGCECLTKFHLNGFNTLLILDHAACRPFCATRAGLNLGEGAGFVVLETAESAKRRNRRSWGFLSGVGNACDAFHQTATSPNGNGACLAMAAALEDAGLTAQSIDYINAHGTGTLDNDRSEWHAMQRIFGTDIPPFSSTKAFTGHTTSAAGIIEVVICLLSMRGGFIPANLNWQQQMEEGCLPVRRLRQGVALRHVLCNSFGFGGNDTSIILSQSADR